MKLTLFTIHFKGGSITVRAFNYEEAKILAQAEAINRGWDYKILGTNDTLADMLAEAYTRGVKKVLAELSRAFNNHGVTYMLQTMDEFKKEYEV